MGNGYGGYGKPIYPGILNQMGAETTFGGIKTHGADVIISYLGECMGYMHLTAEKHTKPRVELFPDGVRLGCAFITKDALEKIASEHKAFMSERSKVLQA